PEQLNYDEERTVNHSRKYSFELPTRIEFGVGVIETLAELVVGLGGRRVLLVSDPGLVAAGVVGRVSAILTAADLDVITFAGWAPGAGAAAGRGGAGLCKDEHRPVVVGAGAVRALDTARSSALMACRTGHIRYFTGLDGPGERGLSVIAAATTAGTGSE